MKPEELQAIRERLAKTTPGPWSYLVPGSVGAHGYVLFYHVSNRDAEFVCHAREDVPKLLREVERLRQLLKRQVDACMECGGTGLVPSQDYGDEDTYGAPYWCPVCSEARQALEG